MKNKNIKSYALIILLIIPVFLFYVFLIIFNIRLFIIDTSRIGPLIAFMKNFYNNHYGVNIKNSINILLSATSPLSKSFANLFLEEKLIKEKKLFIINGIFNYKIIFLLKKFPKVKNIFFYNIKEDGDNFVSQKKIFFFNIKEIKQGEQLLQHMNIENKNYVCIHNRDSSYLNKYHSYQNWEYHNYRDFSVKNLLPTINYLNEKGIKVIRMGKSAVEKLDLKDSNFFDYVNSDLRNDFNDIFLLSNCKFYLGSDSGIYTVPYCFNKDVSFINFPSISFLKKNHSKKKLPSIIKLLKSKKNNSYLSFKEMTKSSFDNSLDIRDLEYEDLEIISNSDQEILDLTKEIMGDFKIDEKEKNYLKNKFLNNFKTLDEKNSSLLYPNIAFSFLKKYEHLLH
jgi:putative glycosyltransferase (TIGR04372 family)